MVETKHCNISKSLWWANVFWSILCAYDPVLSSLEHKLNMQML